MIRPEDVAPVGKFQRTHALKGELNALFDVLPEEFDETDTPLILSVDGILVPFYIDTMRPKGSASWLVKLEGVDSEESARQFVNQTIYLLREDLPELSADSNGAPAELLVGYAVEDSSAGRIGTIRRLDLDTPNPLFYVDSATDGETILIPIADEFIKEIDHEGRRILMELPAGLIDINRKPTE